MQKYFKISDLFIIIYININCIIFFMLSVCTNSDHYFLFQIQNDFIRSRDAGGHHRKLFLINYFDQTLQINI